MYHKIHDQNTKDLWRKLAFHLVKEYGDLDWSKICNSLKTLQLNNIPSFSAGPDEISHSDDESDYEDHVNISEFLKNLNRPFKTQHPLSLRSRKKDLIEIFDINSLCFDDHSKLIESILSSCGDEDNVSNTVQTRSRSYNEMQNEKFDINQIIQHMRLSNKQTNIPDIVVTDFATGESSHILSNIYREHTDGDNVIEMPSVFIPDNTVIDKPETSLPNIESVHSNLTQIVQPFVLDMSHNLPNLVENAETIDLPNPSLLEQR